VIQTSGGATITSQGTVVNNSTSKHPILANKQQKLSQQMQFKQTLAQQQSMTHS
jgi:hypothetical protein